MTDTSHPLNWLILGLELVTFGGFVGIAISSALMMTPLFRLGPGNWGKVWQALPRWHRMTYLISWAAFFAGFLALTLVHFLAPAAQV